MDNDNDNNHDADEGDTRWKLHEEVEAETLCQDEKL